MPKTDAILTDREGRSMLRFERTLPHPPERVWRALTDPEDQPLWHPTPAEFEPEVGGRVVYLSSGDVPMPDGEVLEYAPPGLLSHTWGEDVLRWELSPQDGGCRIVLTQSFEDHFKAARDASGWDVCLAMLSSALEERHSSREQARQDVDIDWKELNRLYQEKFGISPQEATPPPNQG